MAHIIPVSRRWPNGVVPYLYDPVALPSESITLIEAAMAYYESLTPIRFVARTDEVDHVWFFNAGGCWSFWGRVGGRQYLSIHPVCGEGGTRHEMAHLIGLGHEHTRWDRDLYLDILWENITPESFETFAIDYPDGYPYGPYDFNSIMRYGPYSYSKNGLPTILTKDGRVHLHEGAELTEGDLAALEALYSPPARPPGICYVTELYDPQRVGQPVEKSVQGQRHPAFVRAGKGRAGDALYLGASAWIYAWRLTSPLTNWWHFEAGVGRAGDPLRQWANRELECSVRQQAPAHTVVRFGYYEE